MLSVKNGELYVSVDNDNVYDSSDFIENKVGRIYDVKKQLAHNLKKLDYVILDSYVDGLRMWDYYIPDYANRPLNMNQTRILNLKYDFWPNGQDYPYYVFIVVFAHLEDKVLFDLSGGFGSLSNCYYVDTGRRPKARI